MINLTPGNRRSGFSRLLLVGALLFLVGGCARPAADPTRFARPADVTVSDTRPRQGQVVEFHLAGFDACGGLLNHRGHQVTFRGTNPPRAWIGFDVEAETGIRRVPVRVDSCRRGQPTTDTVRLDVRAGSFPVQHLTLPDTGKVVLSEANRRRVGRERRRIDRALASGANRRLWRESFVPPLDPLPGGGGFGARRIFNGRPRAPHTGVDYPAPAGTPVRAVNRGRVALADELFFAGRAVYLDHGRGLFSLYFHLSEITVVEGQRVERGQVLGTVGSTGRATGPHLHFAMRLHEARVDPSWFFDRERPATSAP